MLKTGWVAATAVLLATGIGQTVTIAQKGKPPTVTAGPSDAVFADVGEKGAPGADRIRSDGYGSETSACYRDGEASRYCGGTFPDPETGLTYDGVGPECSRITADSSHYAFRTISSKCASDTPVPDVGQRRLVLDFSDQFEVPRCENADPADDLISVTVGTDQRWLNVCGLNEVDDVRIVAGDMFTSTSSTVTVYISLHAPPLANTTQFLLEFAQPLAVHDLGSARELMASSALSRAVLSQVTVTRSGKLQKSFVGEYSMPFSLAARKPPMQ